MAGFHVVYYKSKILNLGLHDGTLWLLELYSTPSQLLKFFMEITDMLSLIFTSDNLIVQYTSCLTQAIYQLVYDLLKKCWRSCYANWEPGIPKWVVIKMVTWGCASSSRTTCWYGLLKSNFVNLSTPLNLVNNSSDMGNGYSGTLLIFIVIILYHQVFKRNQQLDTKLCKSLKFQLHS